MRNISSLGKILDKATATAIVAERDSDRYLLTEAMYVAVLMFIAQRYFAGFLKGLGIDGLGEEHGRRAAAILNSIRTAGPLPLPDQFERDFAQDASAVLRHRATEAARMSARSEVERALTEGGCTDFQSRTMASLIETEMLRLG
jgi:hypothetical protein